jgi:tripartite-type tricarboxylate transporter receptor subunit TctC
MFAPKGTPQNVQAVLGKALKEAAMTDTFKKAMNNLGQQVEFLDQPAFAKFWDDDAKRIEDAVRTIGKA